MAEQNFNTNLSVWTNSYVGLLKKDFGEADVKFDEYSKECVVAAMGSIYQLMQSNKTDMNALNTSSLKNVLGQVASLKLNANSMPREVYFSTRKKQNAQGKWEQIVEMGVEGDGNDALLRTFGVNVDTVYPCWLVKEGDVFIPPKHKGMKVTPPEWEERGKGGKVIKVVYPILLKDGSEIYLIAEREDVKVNLLAHIRNNMMNETFGVCKDRYNATDAQKTEIKAKKEEVLDEVRKCESLEDILACKVAKPFISAAWLDTPEAMIVRKMRNNAIKKFPKNLNSIANRSLIQLDEAYQNSQEEIVENENSEEFIVEGEAVVVEEGEVVIEG